MEICFIPEYKQLILSQLNSRFLMVVYEVAQVWLHAAFISNTYKQHQAESGKKLSKN